QSPRQNLQARPTASAEMRRLEGSCISPEDRPHSGPPLSCRVSTGKGRGPADSPERPHPDEHGSGLQMSGGPAKRRRFPRSWTASFLLGHLYLLQNLENARAPLDGIVEMEDKLRRVFQR